jgi:hypothetical protein
MHAAPALTPNEIPSDPFRLGKIEWMHAVQAGIRELAEREAGSDPFFHVAMDSPRWLEQFELHRLADTCMPDECAAVMFDAMRSEYGVILTARRRPSSGSPR